jgi:hypothetical protein
MILETPERWVIIEEDIRSYLMPHFPYGIYYRALSDRVHILAFKLTADTLITGGIVNQIENG